MVLFFVGLFSMMLVFAGGKESVAHVFGPVLLWSSGIFAASALTAQGLTYLGIRLYFPRSKAGWVAFLASAALCCRRVILAAPPALTIRATAVRPASLQNGTRGFRQARPPYLARAPIE